jgi:subtilisin family serine protease
MLKPDAWEEGSTVGRSRLLLGALIAALVSTLVAASGAAAAARPLAMGNYIVVLKGSAGAPGAVAAHQARTFRARVGYLYGSALKGYSATLPLADVGALRRDPSVAYVAEDRAVHTDAQTLPTGINRVDGELSSTVSGNGRGSVDVDVAVIDTGISTGHPELNVAGGKVCNGASFNDQNGHGSHVAGTIGARDNRAGVVGVAPGARLWAVRVLNAQGSGSFAQVICGVDWVTAHASTIEVANMSLGGPGFDPGVGCSTGDALHDAICHSVEAGVTYVVAAGNSDTDASGFVPAAYDEVITVSALADFNGKPGGGARPTCRPDVDDTRADFSNFGPDVDLIAPGVCILSTFKGTGFATLSGTSMASPHVAGAAALYKSTHPGASPAAVKTALQAAGNLNWNASDDPDGIKEKLLNVDAL